MTRASTHEPHAPTDADERQVQPAASPAPAAGAAPGALLAVCGLCGGAGASTLAYLIACDAIRSSDDRVLVCDTGGPTGGLAAYARVESPRSLLRTAEAVAARESLAGGLFARAEGGLRVIAGPPQREREADADAVASLLADARAAHALTVIDCGTLQGPADHVVLAAATHIAWVLPATRGGVMRARRALEVAAADAARPQLVLARRDPSAVKAPTDDLKALAELQAAPLVLMPHVPDLAEEPVERALDAAALTLEAIRGVLRR